MTTLQLSSRDQREVEEDLDSAESGGHQYDAHGRVIEQDDEYSVSMASERGGPLGLSAKQRHAQEERATLGKNETQAILCLRGLVLLALILIAVGCSVAVYFVALEGQKEEYAEEFGNFVHEVIEAFHGQLERKLDATDTLSTDITSYALATGSEFPFVTVPDFEFKGANARIAGDSVMTYYMPYITEEMKAPWEAYAAANLGHDSAAYASEQTIKKAQDESFGLTTPEIEGLALEYIQRLVSNNTAKIWNGGQDAVEVRQSVVLVSRSCL
jgi:hypothetical protein